MNKPVTAYVLYFIHLGALLAFFVPFEWECLFVALFLCYLRSFSIGAGFHRYFSHHAFKTSRFFQFILALIGSTAFQGNLFWWVGVHRHHHKFADTSSDLHTPTKGLFWGHMGWLLSDDYLKFGSPEYLVSDLNKYPELRFINKYWLIPGVIYCLTIFLIGGLPYLVWGFFVSTVILYHITFIVNSIGHTHGKQEYKTKDNSQNSFWISLITLGEGWHNNHHKFPFSARAGLLWWQYDATFYILKILSWLGLVWDLRNPPKIVKH